MGFATTGVMGEHEPSGRVRAFDAAVRLAIEEANTEHSFSYHAGLERGEVLDELDGEVSERTVDRALKDAAALGWLTDDRQGWGAGERAEKYE